MAKEGIRLALTWVPRESNQKAGDLSNMKTEAFDPNLRLDSDPAGDTWEALTDYLAAGRRLHEGAQARKKAKRLLSPRRRRGAEREK